jgi:hypothetical protein
MVAISQTGSVRDFPAYLHFTPRPDQPERFDEQTAFYESKGDGCLFLTGGNGAGTTSCLIAKICRFVLETPPPRRDTPFWVIAETYEQIGSMWDEKFNQQGHLPPDVVDWPRIHWNNRNNNQPFRVPLKSPPGHPGKNWSLEFKSWRQGRGKMQARSLGGFGFIEQFPWGILEEVLRGCREYNFPGSKLVEFTPVDADLSQTLEEMIENGYEPEKPIAGLKYLPKNWQIFHANTMCAMEAGHVDKRWFEEFFGMVPADMLETRMKGMFSTYEGVIYKDFNVATHCMGDEMWGRIKSCRHRRGIDWGAGPENDFVCNWGAKNGLGQWFIYDEEVSNDQSKTTVDHLTDVYHKWEWPADNSLYGPTYCDPSSPDNLRIGMKLNQYNPEVENLSMMRGKNSVLEGIEHIQYLLKPQIPVPVHDARGMPVIDTATGKVKIKLEPKLFIHRTNCPKLVQQMKTYRWLRGADPSVKAGRNPKDPLRAPLKRQDHSCLVGDAMISIAGGQKMICDIKSGDYVVSHLGLSKVLSSQCTGIRQIFEVKFSDGTVLRCTEDHPIWQDNQYRTCRSLITSQKQESDLSSSCSKESSTQGVSTQNIEHTESISPARSLDSATACTGRCTKGLSAKYLTDSKFTTKTETHQITCRVTCKQSRRQTTQSYMPSHCQSDPVSAQPAGWNSRQEPLNRGCAAVGVGSLIELKEDPALSAEPDSQFTVSKNQRHAAKIATTNCDHCGESRCTKRREKRVNTQSASLAASAEKCPELQRQKPVAVNVIYVTVVSVHPLNISEHVYNLATEDGTYFANGILTSNCDALRYLCFSDDFMTGSTISSAKAHSAITTQLSGEYLPDSGRLKGFTTRHRERG